MATRTTIRTGKNGKSSISTRAKTGNTTVTKTRTSKGKLRTTVTTRSGNTTRTRVY